MAATPKIAEPFDWRVTAVEEPGGRLSALLKLAWYTGQDTDCLLIDATDARWLHSLQDATERGLPAIVVGPDRAATAVQAFRAGAKDYLIEDDLTPDSFASAVDGACRARADTAQQRLEIALVASGGIVFDWDLATGRVERLLGRKQTTGYDDQEDDERREWWLEKIHPEDRGKTLAGAATLPADQNGAVSEYRFRHRDGRWIWIREYAKFLRNPTGDIVRVIGYRSDVTKEREAEQEREASRERLRLAISAAGALSFVWDIPEDRIYREHSAHPVLPNTGSNPERLESLLHAIHPEDRKRFRQTLKDALAHPEQPYSAEFRILRDNGEVHWMRDVGKVETDAAGRAVRLIGLSIDITSQKMAQQALESSERRLRLAMTAGNAGAWEWKPLTGEALWSDELRALFGVPPSFPNTPESFLELVHPEDRADFIERVAQLRGGQQTEVALDFRLTRLDGVRRWMNVKSQIVETDSAGRPTSMIGIITDITERKHAEEEARNHAALLDTVIESTTDLVWVKDREGRFTLANRHVIDLLGNGDPTKVIGLRSYDLTVDAGQAGDAKEQDERIMRTGVAETVIGRHGPPGAQLSFQSVKAPLRDASGNVVGLVGVSRDITDTLATNAALQASEQRLAIAKEAAELGIHDYDIRRGIVHWDSRVCELWGVEQSEHHTYETFLSGIHPDDVPRVTAAVAAAQDPRGSRRLDIKYRARNRMTGAVRWVRATGHVFFDGDEAVRLTGTLEDVNELHERQMEEAKRLRLIEASPDFIATADLDGRLTYVNSAGRRMIGIAPGRDIHTIHFIDYVPEQWRDFFIGTSLRKAREEGMWEGEMQLRNMSTGETIDVFRHTFLIRDPETGDPLCFATVTRDITEQKRIEAERERVTALLEAFSKSAPVGFGFWDKDLRFQMVNEGLAEMNGLPVEAHIGRTVRELLPNLAGAAEELYRTVASTGKPVLEHEVIGETPAAPGVIRSWSETWFPVIAKDGRMLGVGGVVLETTERKRAEEAARVAHDRLQLIVDTCGIGITFFDITTGETISNAVVNSQIGLPADTLITPELYMTRVHSEDRDRVWNAFQNTLRTGKQMDIEYRTFDAVGRMRWIRSSAKTLNAADGTPKSFYSVSIDMTAQKRIEDTLRSANEDLNRFAYAAAHDLREPLRNVGVNTEMLAELLSAPLEQIPPGRVKRLQSTITDGVRRMDRLLADLLEYSQAGEDAADAPIADFNVALDQAITNLRETIAASGAVITAATLPKLRARESELVSVFQNLISNAMKYRRSEAPRIVITADRRPTEWLISVQDNGIGIEPEYTRLIFGMFKRLHGRNIPGTGIGLAICEKVITRHGGRIWVESEFGKGSTFKFTWPIEGFR